MMFDYEIVVRKADVQFKAIPVGSKTSSVQMKGMSHADAPKQIRAIYEKIGTNDDEVDFLYEATKLFKARKISVTNT